MWDVMSGVLPWLGRGRDQSCGRCSPRKGRMKESKRQGVKVRGEGPAGSSSGQRKRRHFLFRRLQTITPHYNMVTAKQWVVAKRPEGPVQLEGANATFKIVEEELPALSNDQLLVKPLYMSNDPAQRMWIDAKTVAERTYRPPVQEGEIMATAGSVCEVLER